MTDIQAGQPHQESSPQSAPEDQSERWDLSAWLSAKPFWEQTVWDLSIRGSQITDQELDECYRLLLEDLGLVTLRATPRSAISFDQPLGAAEADEEAPPKIQLVRVREIANVNALAADCDVSFGPQLTMIYGANGSGKSGVKRLLASAGFARGPREILPDARQTNPIPSPATATLTLVGTDGQPRDVAHVHGAAAHPELKRFSVFDGDSVLVHLDQSNTLTFTPAQIKMFDRATGIFASLEQRLDNDRGSRRKPNPFLNMFTADSTSSAAVFCRGITGVTDRTTFDAFFTFDQRSSEARRVELTGLIEAKTKLDVPKRKQELSGHRQDLTSLLTRLTAAIFALSDAAAVAVNDLVSRINNSEETAKQNSLATIDNEGFLTIGSSEWKDLIRAAKALSHSETVAQSHTHEDHCLLCHQVLDDKSKSLFEKYWAFLSSPDETALATLRLNLSAELQTLTTVVSALPTLDPSEPVARILQGRDPTLLASLISQCQLIRQTADEWHARLAQRGSVEKLEDQQANIASLTTLIEAIAKESGALVDPVGEVTMLREELQALEDLTRAQAVREEASDYLDWLKWHAASQGVNFSGLRSAITRKRTEAMLASAAVTYSGLFNTELDNLGCDLRLTIFTSGEQGNTVKEFKLEFDEDHLPSQILSEGERNVCALADFLTEIQMDRKSAGIVFDDPVTSMDIERKDAIARRLVQESKVRQVIIMSHDAAFLSQLAKYSYREQVDCQRHWIEKRAGVPGTVHLNESPKLTNVSSLVDDSRAAMVGFGEKTPKAQEHAFGVAVDYLRDACEALIEEKLFGGVVERYRDDIHVTKLSEAFFNEAVVDKLIDLHGRLSEYGLMHNRSGQKRIAQPTQNDFDILFREFDDLKLECNKLSLEAKKLRRTRDDRVKNLGWQ